MVIYVSYVKIKALLYSNINKNVKIFKLVLYYINIGCFTKIGIYLNVMLYLTPDGKTLYILHN